MRTYRDEVLANAHLIATAPDLLAALTRAVQYFGDNGWRRVLHVAARDARRSRPRGREGVVSRVYLFALMPAYIRVAVSLTRKAMKNRVFSLELFGLYLGGFAVYPLRGRRLALLVVRGRELAFFLP